MIDIENHIDTDEDSSSESEESSDELWSMGLVQMIFMKISFYELIKIE